MCASANACTPIHVYNRKTAKFEWYFVNHFYIETIAFSFHLFYGYHAYTFLEYLKKQKFKPVLFFKRPNKRKKRIPVFQSTKISRLKLKVPFIHLFSNNVNRICPYLSQFENEAWACVLTTAGFALSFLTLTLNFSIWLDLWNKLREHTAVTEREIK